MLIFISLQWHISQFVKYLTTLYEYIFSMQHHLPFSLTISKITYIYVSWYTKIIFRMHKKYITAILAHLGNLK